jgi:hypothetical protein
MHKIARQSIIFFVIANLLLVSLGTSALAQDLYKDTDYEVENMLADAAVIRPLGIVATVVGTIVFALSYPFSALGGNADQAYQKLVVDPARFTFKRPLGEF